MTNFRAEYSCAKKMELDGRWFDSQAEAYLYVWLKNEMEKGVFTEIKCQDSVYLSAARFLYKPDFRCTLCDQSLEWHEMKGFETNTWRRNRKLWKCGYGPGKLTVWKKNRRGIYIHEVIVPQKVAA